MTKVSWRIRILTGLAAEVSFAVLPLLVVLMVLNHTNHGTDLFASPEWSFGSAILFGQALTKLVAGLARTGEAAPGPVALLIALVVVFGLVPSLLALSMTLTELPNDVGGGLKILQVVLFMGAAATYMILGTVGEQWARSVEPGS
jgi:hypothetical protein